MKKRIYTLTLSIILAFSSILPVFAARKDIEAATSGLALELSSESAVLMEAKTGEIVYEQNPCEKLEPASVTKIMSLLLFCEAIDGGMISLSDTVTASAAAASMGGSQIWLEEGEQMTVSEMLKAITVVSANDCTVAMAEHLAGSEEAFVSRMNKRAEELGMADTHFSNSTGLPAENHLTTAKDIAIMTRELLKHPLIFDYTTIWMDSVRGGEMALSNTNKLIRFYPGATGMKTGYTDSALYCLSATAKRDNLELIAVTMKSPTSDNRFSDAKKLLDFGFANFAVYKTAEEDLPKLRVKGGKVPYISLSQGVGEILTLKGKEKGIISEITLPKEITAPIKTGDVVGKITYKSEGETVAEVDIVANESVDKMGFWDVAMKLLESTFALG